MTKNEEAPSAKREDAISNSEVHLSKIEPAQVRKNYKGRSRFRTGDLHRLRKGSQPEIASCVRGVGFGDLYSIPGELDITDTHTPTPEVPRRTSLVRNLRRPWAPREHSPERTNKAKIKKVDAPPPCAVTLAKCRRLGARYPAQAGQAGAGGSPFDECISGFCLQSRRGARR